MKIFILGGGFAGIKSAQVLSKELSGTHEIYLINKQEYTTLLPNLPEIVSGRFKKEDITENITKLIPSNIKLLKEEVVNVNFDNSEIRTKNSLYKYDYLIFALGSKTNFYNFTDNLDKISILDNLESANKVREDFLNYLQGKTEASLVISGAGFTGIELACNLFELAKKQNVKLEVNLVELGKKIMPMISEKAQAYMHNRLSKMNFKFYTENQIANYNGEDVTLITGEVIKKPFFCWCSGVESSLKPEGDYEKLRDGRIMVDKYMKVEKYNNVFIAGDAAAIKDKNNNILRRGVNFSQESGKIAAKNIAAQISGKEKSVFNPIDLGWMLPMYIASVGQAMGIELKGRKGIFMHYFICGIKNYNFKNFVKEFWSGIKYSFTKL